MISSAYLSDVVKLVKVADAAGAATSTVTSAAIDMANAEGVLFFTSFATPAANNTLKVQQSNDAGGSPDDFTDVAGSSVGVGASDEDVYIDVKNSGKRYLQVLALRGTSTACGDIWAVVYGLRSSAQAVNTISGTQTGEQTNSPAEGTA